MRGLQGTQLGFAAWDLGHPAQMENIARVFLDTFPQYNTFARLDELIETAEALLYETYNRETGEGVPPNRFWANAAAHQALRSAITTAEQWRNENA
jgi:hypothetical protein